MFMLTYYIMKERCVFSYHLSECSMQKKYLYFLYVKIYLLHETL